LQRVWILIAPVIMAAAVPVIDAFAQTPSDAFASGTAAFERGDYEDALTQFERARAVGSQGPAVHYNIGVCQYSLGDYGQAGATFASLADDYPAMRGLALYNLGLVRLRQGRQDEARRTFERARRDGLDANVTRLAEAALSRLVRVEASEEPSTWLSLIDLSVGHDDNVALIDDTTLPAGLSVASAFTELVAVISGPLDSVPGFRFDGSAYAVRYNDTDQYDQTAVRLGAVYTWNSGAWRMEAGPHFTYSVINGDGFERRTGAGLRFRRNLSSSLRLGFDVVHDEVADIESQYAFVEGSRDRIGVTLDRYSDDGRFTVGYVLEENDRADPAVSPKRNSLSFRYRHTMSARWATDTLLAFRSSGYDELAGDRDETRTELGFGFTRDISRGWQVNGDYRWYDNDSNLDAYSYTRSRVVFGLTKNF
jgi:tetratricopeptide (TPR) repeat protein